MLRNIEASLPVSGASLNRSAMQCTVLRETQSPLFTEQWQAGTYLVSVVFFFDGSGITPAGITDAISPLYESTKKQRRCAWPRGLSGFYIIPIFTAASFCKEVIQCVHMRMPFHWAIWPEPVL